MQNKEKKKKKLSLTTLIFIALLAGALTGVVINYLIPANYVVDDIIVQGVFYIVGQGFIRLMRMLVAACILFDCLWKYGSRRHEKAWKCRRQNIDFLPLHDSNRHYSSAQHCEYFQSGKRTGYVTDPGDFHRE